MSRQVEDVDTVVPERDFVATIRADALTKQIGDARFAADLALRRSCRQSNHVAAAERIEPMLPGPCRISRGPIMPPERVDPEGRNRAAYDDRQCDQCF